LKRQHTSGAAASLTARVQVTRRAALDEKLVKKLKLINGSTYQGGNMAD